MGKYLALTDSARSSIWMDLNFSVLAVRKCGRGVFRPQILIYIHYYLRSTKSCSLGSAGTASELCGSVAYDYVCDERKIHKKRRNKFHYLNFNLIFINIFTVTHPLFL